jgi:hypothetical protein
MKAKKRRYHIYINEEIFEGLRALVYERGMNMSEYLESLITENYKGLKVMQGVKHVENINLKQLMTLFSMAAKGLSSVEKKRK